MPWELDELLDPVLLDEGLRRLAPLSRIAAELRQAGDHSATSTAVAALETSLYMRNQLLRDADWAGMAHSSRDPRALCRPISSWRRCPARRRCWRQLDAKRAVADIRSRPCRRRSRTGAKTGFVTPVGRWMPARGAAESDVNFSAASRAWASARLARRLDAAPACGAEPGA